MVRNNSTSNVDLYQSELPQPQKEIVKRLRAFIARLYPELTESWKWTNESAYRFNGKRYIQIRNVWTEIRTPSSK